MTGYGWPLTSVGAVDAAVTDTAALLPAPAADVVVVVLDLLELQAVSTIKPAAASVNSFVLVRIVAPFASVGVVATALTQDRWLSIDVHTCD